MARDEASDGPPWKDGRSTAFSAARLRLGGDAGFGMAGIDECNITSVCDDPGIPGSFPVTRTT